ncbi:MAG: FMN-binding protein [Sedimentisphaerales bacterium]|nr:FMN-binding protein [Sedimentisphaerales bacterium]
MKRLFPVIYMFVITAALSAVVIGFARFTEKRVQANESLAFEIAVLKVVPDLYDEKLSSMELHKIFTGEVKEPAETTAGAYFVEEDGQIAGYALPIAGQGFWASIRAVVGIKPDKRTVTGFAVYEQRETPGLGAEVAQIAFTEQFKNLKLSADGKPVVFRRPGETLQKSQVHAVTGATQTSTRLEKIINDALAEWRKKVKNN